MKDKITGRPDFLKELEKLMQKIENRDKVRQMSDKELRDLKRTIDEEMIRRKVMEHIQMLTNQRK